MNSGHSLVHSIPDQRMCSMSCPPVCVSACSVPGIAMSAHDVAVEGVAGILQGRSMVVPGLVNKIYMLGTLWMPPKILRFINEMAWS